MVFNIPKKIDEFYTLQFLLFFLIGFMMNVYSNGQATLIFLDEYHNLNPLIEEEREELFSNFDNPYSQQQQAIQDFTNQTYFNSNLARNLSLILYWGVSPALNFFYSIFIFKKGTIWV